MKPIAPDDPNVMVFSVPAAIAPVPQLTDAEQGVAELVVEGRSNHEIAEARGVSVKTVANQLRAIYQKLGIASRYELVALLIR